MTEQPDAGREDYDPATDPDADPENLNPRTGGAARQDDEREEDEREEYDDTDADPGNLNPRSTIDEPGS